MTHPASIRFEQSVLDRLREFVSTRPDTSLSAATNRLVDEGLRMEQHPLVVFADGPTGRRARLMAGPDIWEIVAAVRSARASEPGLSEHEIIELVAATAGISEGHVRAAIDYWSDFPGEIDDEIARAHDAEQLAFQRWELQRKLLAR
jgi:hypothetical protein